MVLSTLYSQLETLPSFANRSYRLFSIKSHFSTCHNSIRNREFAKNFLYIWKEFNIGKGLAAGANKTKLN